MKFEKIANRILAVFLLCVFVVPVILMNHQSGKISTAENRRKYMIHRENSTRTYHPNFHRGSVITSVCVTIILNSAVTFSIRC